jgi:hypothetical protein
MRELKIDAECKDHLRIVTFIGSQFIIKGACHACKWVDNLIFDTASMCSQNIPFTHNFKSKVGGVPCIILCLIFIEDKWTIISFGQALNDVPFLTGKTFGEILAEGFRTIAFNVLPKNQIHFFGKSLSSILTADPKIGYVVSFNKKGQQQPQYEAALATLFNDEIVRTNIICHYTSFPFPNIQFHSFVRPDLCDVLEYLMTTKDLKKTYMQYGEKLKDLFPRARILMIHMAKFCGTKLPNCSS